MAEYRLAASAEAERLLGEAEQKAIEAAEANQTSDNYVVTAVLFASALFFSAMSSKLVGSKFKVTALLIAAAVFFGTTIFVFTLPIEI